MHVFIAGANGQIGQHLLREMSDSDHEARALVRHPDQGPELQKLGATETVLGNLEQDCSEAMRGCDAVIFSAGSGPHTGPDKTIDVDQDGAIRLVDAAKAMGIKRFIIVSSMGADEPEKGPEKLRHYLWAKHNADEHLKQSGLNYTIVRPGQLTDDDGTGKVKVSAGQEAFGKIPRQDVARVLLAALDLDNASNRVFEVVSGDTPVSEALAAL
ncbi:SDR family oxidoreductase [Marinobacter halophilus]|uniref:NAD-dependent dehydratase n=1 Tax=Marinobacter halophilus TaxID=1323740 RepID=A0A2T1KDB4_9GAMM|nr:SDR family oxidoreductase [Marinobacter halophilus]PSF08040.1 NAD-dependent dehydratase [Marinobacter halophilus]GGC59242.1 putative sugar epimerase YhfK [Marinobacter halophilus]